MFPKFKHHRTLPPIIVNAKGEEDALGPGWADSMLSFGVITCPEEGQGTYDPDFDIMKSEQELPIDPPKRKGGRPRKVIE